MAEGYWIKREKEHIEKNKKTDAEMMALIRKKQKESMRNIEKEINAFYGKFATTEGITMAEARKRVDKLDIEAYADKAKRYVSYAHSDNPLIQALAFTDKAHEEMRIYNVTMKINRLELLKANVALELAALASAEERFLLEKLTEGAREEYLRQSGILGMALNANEKDLVKIVNASFHSATWSDRIWANQAALKSDLNKLMTRGIVNGNGPKELARELRKAFEVSIKDSERLAITEMARIQTDVFFDSMNQADITEYTWVAEGRACPLCSALNGRVFDKDDVKMGINTVPRHPRCRCSLAMHIDRNAWEADLKRRGL